MSLALVADVGGTHTRLALARRDGARARIEALEVTATPRGQLLDTLRAYLAAHRAVPTHVAIAAAGRVRHLPGRSHVALTNAGLVIEREALQEALGVRALWLINDLAAVAAALPWLDTADLQPLGVARAAVPEHRLAIGLGTGFGAAALTANGTLIETEAGHASLAAGSAVERHWLNVLAPRGRCSVEQVLSGPGLLRLHEAVTRHGVATHEELQARCAAGEPGAVRTLNAFSTWLGRTAGDLVLAHGAWGGVALTGGVVQHLGHLLDGAAFRAGFEDKAPFSADLAAVPVWTVLHSQPALLGLARLALGDAAGP